jgi:protein-L-isoaspartate(D-aspartate) O-methyltransferase
MSHSGRSRGVVRPQGFASSIVEPARRVDGLGLVSDRQRQRMCERLRLRGIRAEPVLAAMGRVERHRFVDPALASRAYDDDALPIGHRQTISHPWSVARMMELALTLGAGRRHWLEVGSGCGYQAAVMAQLCEHVTSIERIAALCEHAGRNLAAMGVNNVRLVHGDGMLGIPTMPGFDAIVLAAAGTDVPPDLVNQLATGGVLAMPVQRGAGQVLLVVRKDADGRIHHAEAGPANYVPLLGGVT